MAHARLAASLALSFWSLTAQAADLTQIGRTLKHEPVYQGKPKYCLLALGPEATTRVWLVLDDDNLYVDRNGNGDLTEPGERFPMPKFKKSDHPAFNEERELKVGDLSDGPRTHTDLEITQIRLRKDYAPMSDEERDFLRFFNAGGDGVLYSVSLTVQRPTGPVRQTAFADARGCLQFAKRPQDAPV